MKLQNKVAIITGGNSGVGLATACLFAQQGAKVVITGRNVDRGQQAVQSIKEHGTEAIFIPCDVRKAEDCQEVVDQTIREFGRVDILINNAGIVIIDLDTVSTTEEQWRETIDTNLTGAFFMSKYAIPKMIEAGGGAIVNVSSIYGIVGGFGAAAYCAAKGGMVLLTKSMALDYASKNIRVNCTCPGSIDTPMLQNEWIAMGKPLEEYPSTFAAKHPMNRISTPEEQAAPILFLASDDSSFITGAILPVDGGRSTW